MPMRRELYPTEWATISAAARVRAGDCCEQCGSPHGAYVTRGNRAVRIVLTVHHVVPTSQGGTHDASNLRVLCQRCHLAADAPLHQAHAAQTRARKRAAALTAAGQESLL